MTEERETTNKSKALGKWTSLKFMEPFVRHLSRWGIWTIAIGFLCGVGAWAWLRDSRTFRMHKAKEHLIKLDVRVPEQLEALAWGAGALLCLLTGYGLYALWRRKRSGVWPQTQDYKRLNLLVLPLAFPPILSAFAVNQLEKDFELLTLALIAGLAGGSTTWVYALSRQCRFSGETCYSRLERLRVPQVLVGVLMIAYSFGLSRFALFEHWAFQTHSYDLGIYDNTFWNTAHGDWLRCTFTRGDTHISAHFDPIIILLSPIYKLYPRVESLLVLQSVWLSLGSIPLFLHARRVLKDAWLALVSVFLYLGSTALHGVNLFDFHSLALMTPFAMWLVYAIDAKKYISYWIALVLMLLVREDMPLIACVIAAYAIVMGRRRLGLGTIVLAVAYLFLVKHITHLVLPDGKGKNSYYYYYGELILDDELGAPGLLISALSDPVATLAVLFKPEKLLYFIKVLLPVFGLPLLAGKKLLLYSYGFAFIGLASRKYVYTVHFQYSILLVPFLYMGLPDGLRRLMASRFFRQVAAAPAQARWALVAGACVATVGVGSMFGALLPNESFRGGWNPLIRDHDEERAEVYQEFRKVVSLIPEVAPICTFSNYAPHVSNRPTVRRFPSCSKTDYILSPNRLSKKDRKRLNRYKKDKRWELVTKTKRFILLRKASAK